MRNYQVDFKKQLDKWRDEYCEHRWREAPWNAKYERCHLCGRVRRKAE